MSTSVPLIISGPKILTTDNNKNVHVDPFWLDYPMILIESDRLTEFFPNKLFSLNEKLNSIVRLGMYISIILIFYDKNVKWLSIFIFTLLITYYIYVNNPNTENKIEKYENVSDVVPEITTPDPVNIDDHQYTGNYSQTQYGVSENKSTNYPNKSESCTRPSIDNPFMNMTMKDYLNFDKSGNIIDRPAGCDGANPEIKKEIDDNFKNNLFRNVDDVFGKFNSQRQFFTMPWTEIIPDIKGEFKNWLYNNPKSCKEDQDYCLLYEDIRAKRPVT